MNGLDMTPVQVPREIAPTELLGRAVNHGKDRDRAARGAIPASLFVLRKDEEGISVDRLTHAPPDEALAIANKRAAEMEPVGKRTFYGWVVISAERAQRCARIVCASPLKDGSNDYHAEITYPDSYIDDEGKEVDHTENLSDLGCWLPFQKLHVIKP